MARLRLVTIGSRTSEGTSRGWFRRSDLEGLRQRGVREFGAYMEKVTNGRETETQSGDSIVREFSIHDNEHFSLEQDISIYITNALGAWLGKLAALHTHAACSK